MLIIYRKLYLFERRLSDSNGIEFSCYFQKWQLILIKSGVILKNLNLTNKPKKYTSKTIDDNCFGVYIILAAANMVLVFPVPGGP